MKTTRIVRIIAVAAMALLVIFAGSYSPAQAATLTVTKTEDTFDAICDADCSLREATGAAKSGERIIVPAGTYTLTIGSPLTIATSMKVTGDGAAGFNFMEMQSAAREGLKIVTVVFAEGSWTLEEPGELMNYGRTFGTEQGTIRWDIVGEGLGCKGFYVESRDELVPALEQARAADGPTVVCLRTSREANLATPRDPLMRFVEVYQGPMG